MSFYIWKIPYRVPHTNCCMSDITLWGLCQRLVVFSPKVVIFMETTCLLDITR